MIEMRPEELPAANRALLLARAREVELSIGRLEVERLRIAEELARSSPSAEPLVIDGQEVVAEFGGEGTTPAGQFVIAELAAACGATEASTFTLVADAVELVQRLPLLWGRVELSLVEPWRARRIARATRALSPAAAAEVDRRVAEHADAIGLQVLARLVAATALECGEAERLIPPRRRKVDVHTPAGSGNAFIDAVTDAHSATLFDAELSRIAAALLRDGDADTFDERRAKAIGIMANPEHHLALVNGKDAPSGARPRLVLHVTVTDQALLGSRQRQSAERPSVGAGPMQRDDAAACATPTLGPPDGRPIRTATSAQITEGGTVVDAGRLGPQLLHAVREWAGHSHVTIRPVIDTEVLTPVDAYHVPTHIREAVEHRHPTCVFPWCTRPTRGRGIDLDHIEPYEPDKPGQTSVKNLAPLCRHHHRLKTHGAWTYRALGPTTYVWASPDNATFVRGPEGTHRVTDQNVTLRAELKELRRQLNGGVDFKPLPQSDIRVVQSLHRRVAYRRVAAAAAVRDRAAGLRTRGTTDTQGTPGQPRPPGEPPPF